MQEEYQELVPVPLLMVTSHGKQYLPAFMKLGLVFENVRQSVRESENLQSEVRIKQLKGWGVLRLCTQQGLRKCLNSSLSDILSRRERAAEDA